MLKYVGNGSFLPDVPARDLSDEEARKFGEEDLLKSGLYKREIQVHREFKRAKEKEGDS